MGERILVDTDCLIDYYKGGLELNPEDSHHVSEITVYEFIRGTRNVKEAKKILRDPSALFGSTTRFWRKPRKYGGASGPQAGLLRTGT
jgi:predicted nucleic acid-binding protein